MAKKQSGPLLVAGASGHLGRRVVQLLLEAGAGPIIGVTRNPDRIADLAARGVTVRRGDFDDPHSLSAAFAGAERMLLISTSDADPGGRRVAQHRAAVAAAVQAGVRHVIYTSLVYPDPGNPIAFAYQHFETEQALVNTPLDFTILRDNLYAEVVLWTLPRAVATGQLVAAAGDGGVAYVTRDDVARAAATVLADSTAGRRYRDVTGPEVITHAELARIASVVTGRPVAYVRVQPEDVRKALIAAGVPEGGVDTAVSLDVAIAQGRLGYTTNAVLELTGGVPRTLMAFLVDHKAALLAASHASPAPS